MEELKEHLEEHHITPNSIEIIKHGCNHDTYHVIENDNQYIAHVGREKRDTGSSLMNTYRALSFLNAHTIEFVPQLISFDEVSDILVETHVGTKDTPIPELSEMQLDTFVRQLAVIHSFVADVFQHFCKENGLPVSFIQTPLHNIETFGIKRFQVVELSCPDSSVISWIKPKLEQSIEKAKAHINERVPHLQQGDIGGNTRTDGNDVFAIDWEFSTLAHNHELAYIKIHSHPSPEQFEFIVERYAHYSGIDISVLHKEIEIDEKIIRVNDVIWAAMKWGESKDKKIESEKFKKLTYRRIDLFEDIRG